MTKLDKLFNFLNTDEAIRQELSVNDFLCCNVIMNGVEGGESIDLRNII